MRKRKRRKMIAALLAMLLLAWAAMGMVDYVLTMRYFEKPVFASLTVGADDGGSGLYRGIGYAVELTGNFLPEDEFPGVTHARFYLFGQEVKSAVRD